MTSFADDYSYFDGLKLTGVDQSQKICVLQANLNDYGAEDSWISFLIRRGSQLNEFVYPGNVGIPVQNVEGDECGSVFLGAPSSFMMSGNQWIQRERMAEFGSNWIKQTTFTFDSNQHKNLVAVEVKESKHRATGKLACRSLKLNELSFQYECKKLRERRVEPI